MPEEIGVIGNQRGNPIIGDLELTEYYSTDTHFSRHFVEILKYSVCFPLYIAVCITEILLVG